MNELIHLHMVHHFFETFVLGKRANLHALHVQKRDCVKSWTQNNS